MSLRPLILFEGSSQRWPQGMAPYFFGYELYKELWAQRQEEGIREFVDETSRITFPYYISAPFKKVYGTDYPSLWKNIFEKNQVLAQKEIKDIEERPLSNLHYLTQDQFTKWDLVFSADGEKFAYRSIHPDTGSTLEIRSVKTPEKALSSERVQGWREEGLCWIKNADKEYIVFSEATSVLWL